MPTDGTHTTASLAAHLNGTLNGADFQITTVNALHDAGPTEISFITNDRYAQMWGTCTAGAAIVSANVRVPDHEPASRALIVVENAELALIRLLELFAPEPPRPDIGVHETAWVHPDATLGERVRIGQYVSVERDAVIGNDVTLHAGVRIAHGVTIGDGSELHPNCVVGFRCELGCSVILHSSVTIGADGFGYRPAADGKSLLRMPHIGNVVLEDNVEIGASSCIDRGKFSSTVIGAGTKLDNLVQVAHNCRIGRGCVVAGQTGFAGSVTVGDGVQVGAQVGVAEGLTIGDGAKIGAKSGVMKDVQPGKEVLGTPAENLRDTLRQFAALRKLPAIIAEFSRQQRTVD